MSSIYAGYIPQPGRWHAGIKVGGVNTPPLEWILDGTLPVLGQDQQYPNRDFVVIPKGRFIAPVATDLTNLLGVTTLTIANGVDPLAKPSFVPHGCIPAGYSPFTFYRNFAGLPADVPVLTKHETIELPYTIVNDAYNTNWNGPDTNGLKTGEWLMPFFGSAVSTTPIPKDVGKFVRWVEKKVWTVTTAGGSGAFVLDKAPFPAFLPRIVFAITAAGLPVASGASLGYDTTLAKWTATFSQTNVHTVVYEYGASSAQRIAQAVGIEPVGTAGGLNATQHEMSGWLKWVTDNFQAWDWPPILSVHPTSTVTQEAVSIDSNNEGLLAHTPIVPFRPITVSVTGTIENPDGTSTTQTGVMALSDTLFFNDQSQGQYFDIDILTGKIRFSANVTVTTCKVDYQYENDFRDGLKWDAGIIGLTDGRDSGIPGLPPHLDVAGVRGAVRMMVL
jgi:hypothetical protein